MANLSGIVKQLSKERNRLHKQLSGLNAALEAFARVYKQQRHHNPGARCRPKGVKESLPLRERVGRKLRGSRKSFRLRSRQTNDVSLCPS